MISRRALLLAAPAFIAARAIAGAASIMSVKPIAMNNTIIAQWLDPVLNVAFDGADFYTSALRYRLTERWSYDVPAMERALLNCHWGN